MQLKHSRIQMYADDIQLYLDCSITFIKTGVKDLNTDLNNISLWATANGLRINHKKSIFKKSTKIESSIDVFLGDSKISQKSLRQSISPCLRH